MNDFLQYGSVVDPLNNPYFGTAANGYSMGNGNGWGFYDWSGIPGAEAFYTGGTGSGDGYQDQGINAQALSDWLKSNGYTLNEAAQGEEAIRYLLDSNGQLVGTPQSYSMEDDKFWTAALLASALTGSAIAGWAGAGAGAEAGLGGAGMDAGMGIGASDATAAAAGGGVGTLSAGSVGAPLAATSAPLSTASLSAGAAPTLAGGASAAGYGSLLNSGLQLGGALYGQYQNNKAADQAAQGMQNGLDLQRYMYDTTRADYAPYRQAGVGALGQIQNLLANPSSITSDPGYQFGLSQGTKALNNGAAAGGMTYSGAQQKALQRYGQDYAGTKLNESYNRLASLAGLGQTATSGTASAGSNYANNGANLLSGMGNVQAASTYGNGQNWLNALGNIAQYGQQQNLFGNGG